MEIVFDIETDGKEIPEVIHCLALYGFDTAGHLTHELFDEEGINRPISEGLKIMDSADYLCGHNIIQYDFKVMENLLGWKPKDQEIRDTMLMSYIEWPERLSHHLAGWFKTVGADVEKVENEDWSVYTPTIADRCLKDVKGNYQVLHYMMKTFSNWKALALEQEVARVHTKQEQVGVKVDIKDAMNSIEYFDKEMARLAYNIRKYAPKKVHGGTYKPIVEPYLKGTKTYKKAVKEWFDDTQIHQVKGGFSRLIIEDFDVNSSKKLKDLLMDLGWRPVEWNVVRDPNGKFRKTSPKITENSFKTIPAGLGEDIKNYNVMKHRRNLLQNIKDPDNKGLLANVRADGRVAAKAIICGTPTSRYRHMGSVCNIPRPSSLYGNEIRRVFSVEFGSTQIGIDLSGIEARMLAHYALVYTKGKQLADEILEGDWHSENATMWGVDRNTAKSLLYALMYGAGGVKLARIAGFPDKEGQKMKDVFYGRWPCMAELNRDLSIAYGRKNGTIVGIAGRKIYVRAERTLLNSLLQHSSAEVFKLWMLMCDEVAMSPAFKGWIRQIIAYHDELQFESFHPTKAFAEDYAKKAQALSADAGKVLGIKVPIASEYMLGQSWADCH